MLVVFLLGQEVCDQIERELSTQVVERNSNESNRLENRVRSTLIPNLNALTIYILEFKIKISIYFLLKFIFSLDLIILISTLFSRLYFRNIYTFLKSLV